MNFNDFDSLIKVLETSKDVHIVDKALLVICKEIEKLKELQSITNSDIQFHLETHPRWESNSQ